MSTTPRRSPPSPARLAVPILALLLALATFHDAAGQSPPITPGDSIRVTAAGMKTVYEVVRLAPGAIVVRERDSEFELSSTSMERMELRTQQSRLRQMAISAAVGGLVGASTGACFGLVSGDDPPSRGFLSHTTAEKAGMLARVMGGAGAGLGLVFGALEPLGARWEPVALDRLALRLAPAPNGATLAFTWRR